MSSSGFPSQRKYAITCVKCQDVKLNCFFFLVFTWRFRLHKRNVPLSGPVFSVSLWSFLGQFLGVLLAFAWLGLTHLGRRPEEVHLPVALPVVHTAVLCSTSTILEHWILVVHWFSEQWLRRFDLSACRDVQSGLVHPRGDAHAAVISKSVWWDCCIGVTCTSVQLNHWAYMLLSSLSLLVLDFWLPCGWAQGLRNCPWLLQVNAWRLFSTACKGLLPQSGSVALWLGHESLKTLLWESWWPLVSSSSRYPVQNLSVWFCSLSWLMLLHVPTKKAKRVDSCKVYFCYFILMFCQTLVIWLASWKAMWSESFQLLPGAVLGNTEGTQLRPPACQQRIGLVSSILPPPFNWTLLWWSCLLWAQCCGWCMEGSRCCFLEAYLYQCPDTDSLQLTPISFLQPLISIDNVACSSWQAA